MGFPEDTVACSLLRKARPKRSKPAFDGQSGTSIGANRRSRSGVIMGPTAQLAWGSTDSCSEPTFLGRAKDRFDLKSVFCGLFLANASDFIDDWVPRHDLFSQ